MADQSTKTDYLVIGGGVIGMSIARELQRRSAGRITLVERGVCGEESSWAAAGMLGAQAETDEPGDMLRFCVESRGLYPGLAAALLDETGIDIELDRAGTLYLAFDDVEREMLKKRVAWQKAAGLNASLLTGAETRMAEPFISPDVIESVLFPDDWQVDNRKLCSALRRYLDLNDVNILENTTVSELIIDGPRIAGIRTASRNVLAGTTVLAVGAWTPMIKLGAFAMPVGIKPIRGQMIAYRTAKRLFERVIYRSGGYIVPRADGRLLVGATSENAGYVKLNTDNGVRQLVESAQTIAPALIGHKIADQWCGLRPRSADELPVLGPLEGLDGAFVATGHYRNGILLAPKTAEIMSDAILGGPISDHLSIFGPGRFRTANARG
ncbi:MAG: glycine oxidase ThiO [Acidobacteriota bacterium]